MVNGGTTGGETATTATSGGVHPAQRQAQARTLVRMERLAREWIDDFTLEAALTAEQEEVVMGILFAFIRAYEGLRWRRGVEEDVETRIARMYEDAEREIVALLGEHQKEGFRGLPRDWGFGVLDPGPGR